MSHNAEERSRATRWLPIYVGQLCDNHINCRDSDKFRNFAGLNMIRAIRTIDNFLHRVHNKNT
jgi:hypothetical protein